MSDTPKNEFLNLFEKKEELHPHLKIHLQTSNGILGVFHPLLFSLFYSEEMNALLNIQYQHKLSSLTKAKDSNNWSQFVFLHERPYRLHAFSEIHNELDDKEYWNLLSSIYVDSENIWQNYKAWVFFLSSKRGERMEFMDEEEQKAFLELPEKITIYRGCIPELNKIGLSYTLSKDVAEWFSRRFSKNGKVISRTVKKDLIFAYKSSRSEEEVIIIPR